MFYSNIIFWTRVLFGVIPAAWNSVFHFEAVLGALLFAAQMVPSVSESVLAVWLSEHRNLIWWIISLLFINLLTRSYYITRRVSLDVEEDPGEHDDYYRLVLKNCCWKSLTAGVELIYTEPHCSNLPVDLGITNWAGVSSRELHPGQSCKIDVFQIEARGSGTRLRLSCPNKKAEMFLPYKDHSFLFRVNGEGIPPTELLVEFSITSKGFTFAKSW